MLASAPSYLRTIKLIQTYYRYIDLPIYILTDRIKMNETNWNLAPE